MAKRYPTLLTDLLILLALASVVIVLTLKTYSGGSGYIEVRTHQAVYRYALSTDQEVSVDGPLGKTDILIKGGRASIIDSACPTKSCTEQRAISSSGEWIACLPNHVLITVVGSESSAEVDDVAI
ncbi:MAG TPA: NusG domain II-containing protein [Sphaerochaeta sp.]|nr:NusG domain II-containing protein [Sphaerochaeta sp.]HPZ16106.1 NusG domain II-containing protein [Sphaerochaeta sp.]